MAALSTAWATSIVKTWANAWTTSARMHETEVLPCLFGCADEPDELQHYIRCSRLWHLVVRADRRDLLSFQPEVAVKLLFVNPSLSMARLVVTMFLTYHEIKHGKLQLILGHIRSNDLLSLEAVAQRVAEAALGKASSTAKPIAAKNSSRNDLRRLFAAARGQATQGMTAV